MGKYYINQYIKNTAKQNQIILRSKYANAFSADAAALGELRGYIDKKTVCDILICEPFYNNIPGTYAKVIAFEDEGIYLLNSSSNNIEIGFIMCNLTQEQYMALAEVQKATGDKNYPNLSVLDYNGVYYLCDDDTQKFICVNGKLVEVDEDDGGKIVALNITNNNASEGAYANISYEVLQKLKGINIV